MSGHRMFVYKKLIFSLVSVVSDQARMLTALVIASNLENKSSSTVSNKIISVYSVSLAFGQLASYGGSRSGGGGGGGGGSADYDSGGSLEETIPGTPGVDYPILAEVPDTGFSCDGQVTM